VACLRIQSPLHSKCSSRTDIVKRHEARRYLRLAIKSNNTSAARPCKRDTFGFRKKAERRAIETPNTAYSEELRRISSLFCTACFRYAAPCFISPLPRDVRVNYRAAESPRNFIPRRRSLARGERAYSASGISTRPDGKSKRRPRIAKEI
jgi:hypothetical protein